MVEQAWCCYTFSCFVPVFLNDPLVHIAVVMHEANKQLVAELSVENNLVCTAAIGTFGFSLGQISVGVGEAQHLGGAMQQDTQHCLGMQAYDDTLLDDHHNNVFKCSRVHGTKNQL